MFTTPIADIECSEWLDEACGGSAVLGLRCAHCSMLGPAYKDECGPPILLIVMTEVLTYVLECISTLAGDDHGLRDGFGACNSKFFKPLEIRSALNDLKTI
jgi:hypothetical protein